MEALYGIPETKLDLIVHSPGGSPEAAEAIVIYLRSKFEHIRVFVPHMAMSAATMIACAADEVVMGKHSFIGPIDPQLQLQTGLGVRLVPAQAIVDQFAQAVLECQDATKIRAWLPMLTQYGPDLLTPVKTPISFPRIWCPSGSEATCSVLIPMQQTKQLQLLIGWQTIMNSELMGDQYRERMLELSR